MLIEYTLQENDYLNHQLFISSKSESTLRKRKRSKFIIPLLYLLFGVFMVFQNNLTMALLFGALSVLWFLFYPKWEKIRYIKHFKNFIQENYSALFNRTFSLHFANGFITATDADNESKISYKELYEINEIGANIFIHLNSGHSFILPKHSLNNLQEVRTFLQNFAIKQNIKYHIQLNWEWK